MIELVSDLPEYTLIEANESNLSNIISKALNYQIYEPLYHSFSRNFPDRHVTVSGIDEKKKKMYERLDQICNRRNIYIDLENYSDYIFKDTVIKEYNITVTDDEQFQKIFGCRPLYRRHITVTDREYQDGRHEQLTSSHELAKKSSTKLRTVTETTYGFMKFNTYTYTLLDVIYEDGSKGLTYSFESDSG